MTPEVRLIQRFIAVFGEPKTPNPEEFLAEFAKAIAGWKLHVLDQVGDEIIRSNQFWPKPAEVNDKASALAEKNPNQKSYHFPAHVGPYDAATLERWQLAKEWRQWMIVEFGSLEAYYAKTRHRPRVSSFEPVGRAVSLSSVSRRMTGEAEE